MDLRNQIADISDDEEMNVLSGMYDAQSFSKNKNNITYTNTIELSGDNENDKVKYEYKNTHSSDLWNELTNSSSYNLSEILPTWIKQEGYPIVKIEKVGDSFKISQK